MCIVYPSSAICVTHLGQEDVWVRQLELGCDVLGLSSRSYRLSLILTAHGASYHMTMTMTITIYTAGTSRSVASESEARGHVTSQDVCRK